MNAATEEEIFEGYKTEMEAAKLHNISNDLQKEYLLFSGKHSETIKSLDLTNDDILNAIFKYSEMVKVQAEVKQLFSNYQKAYYRIRSLSRFGIERRSIGIKINFVMVRVTELVQVFKYFIEFALNDIKKLNEVIADTSNSWEKIQILKRIELIQIFTNRLIISKNQLKECDTMQKSALNVLNEMKFIFNELKGIITFENFVNNFKKLFYNHRNEVIWENYKQKLGAMSIKIIKIHEKKIIVCDDHQKTNEMKKTNSFENDINHWKANHVGEHKKVVLKEIVFKPPSKSENRTRRFVVTSVSYNSVFKKILTNIHANYIYTKLMINFNFVCQKRRGDNSDKRDKKLTRMDAYRIQIENQSLYDMIAFVNGNFEETYPVPDLKTPKKGLLAAIDEYIELVKNQAETSIHFFKLTTEVPKEWFHEEIKNLKASTRSRMSRFSQQTNEFRDIYEEILGFAATIIRELTGIVLEEENYSWNAVDFDDKKELLQMINTRLMACTRLLGFCSELKQKFSPIFIEVKDIYINSYNQSEYMKKLQQLGFKISGKIKEIKPMMDKLEEYVVVDLTKNEDVYGRYEFNKWLHSWRNDIINWKLRAYHGIQKNDIVLVSDFFFIFFLYFDLIFQHHFIDFFKKNIFISLVISIVL